jgi:Fur family transcriptional regulator, ferric uptake regulator
MGAGERRVISRISACLKRQQCLLASLERARLAYMTRKTPMLADDDFKALLAEKGFRVTDQRMTVLRELAAVRTPVSHAELTERLASSDLDRATIYRNLLSLTKAGVLVRSQLGDNIWRFELPTTTSHEHGKHPHFVCNDCGDVACLPINAFTLRGATARNQIDEVQLRGRCITCIGA